MNETETNFDKSGYINRRGGKAVRLSYDHKGTDSSEVKRITDAGGFVLNNRVNGTSHLGLSFELIVADRYDVCYVGVLAVTRALGDSSMKEFVVGKPYTTETTIGERDEWLIVACDGVSFLFLDLPAPR